MDRKRVRTSFILTVLGLLLLTGSVYSQNASWTTIGNGDHPNFSFVIQVLDEDSRCPVKDIRIVVSYQGQPQWGFSGAKETKTLWPDQDGKAVLMIYGTYPDLDIETRASKYYAFKRSYGNWDMHELENKAQSIGIRPSKEGGTLTPKYTAEALRDGQYMIVGNGDWAKCRAAGVVYKLNITLEKLPVKYNETNEEQEISEERNQHEAAIKRTHGRSDEENGDKDSRWFNSNEERETPKERSQHENSVIKKMNRESAAEGTLTIKELSPRIWRRGIGQVVDWTSTNLPSYTLLVIDLYKGGEFYMKIGYNTPNDGSWGVGSSEWSKMEDVTDSSDYQVKISVQDNSSIYDISDYFDIITPYQKKR